MFEPKFNYTDKLVSTLIKIEHHKTNIEGIDLSYESKQKLQNQTKVTTIFHASKLLGINEFSLSDSEKYAFAKNYEKPQNLAYQILINFRNAIEFNRSNIADSYSELDETIMCHLNKLIISNWRENWDARLRNFQESVDENFDYWVSFRDKELNDQTRLNEVKQLIDWFTLNSLNVPFLVRLGVFVYKFIELAPFLAGNLLTMTALVDYIALKNNYGSKLYSSTTEILHTNTDLILNTYQNAKMSHDITFFLEVFTESVLKNLIGTRENLNKFIMEEEKSKQQPFLNLNKRQIKALKYLQTVPVIKREDYCHMMDVSTMTAFRDLNDLLRKKLIRSDGKGRGTHYKLTSM